MNRREFIAMLAGSGVSWAFVAHGQQAEPMRIGMLQALASNDPDVHLRLSTFQRRLQELGWADGHNVRTDYRWAAGDISRMRTQAAELVSLRPDVIVGASTPVVMGCEQKPAQFPFYSCKSSTQSRRASSAASPDRGAMSAVSLASSSAWEANGFKF